MINHCRYLPFVSSPLFFEDFSPPINEINFDIPRVKPDAIELRSTKILDTVSITCSKFLDVLLSKINKDLILINMLRRKIALTISTIMIRTSLTIDITSAISVRVNILNPLT